MRGVELVLFAAIGVLGGGVPALIVCSMFASPTTTLVVFVAATACGAVVTAYVLSRLPPPPGFYADADDGPTTFR